MNKVVLALVIIILIGIVLFLYVNVFYPVLQYGLPIPHPTTTITVPVFKAPAPSAKCNGSLINGSKEFISCIGSDTNNLTRNWLITLSSSNPHCTSIFCHTQPLPQLNYSVNQSKLNWNTTVSGAYTANGNETVITIIAYNLDIGYRSPILEKVFYIANGTLISMNIP